MIWIPILIVTVTLAIDLTTDYRLWLKGRQVKHFRGAILRLLGLIPACILSPLSFIPVLLFGYWGAFDTGWALLTGQKWYYTGSTAELDRLQKRYPFLKVAKYLGFVASIIIYTIFV